MKVAFTVKNGSVSFGVYCLRTDSWSDYRSFFQDSVRHEAAGELRAANRSLRAAIVFFFAHLEAVVDHILDETGLPKKEKRRDFSLCEKIERVGAEANCRDASVERLNIRLEKSLRDIVAHGGCITKNYTDSHGKQEVLDQNSIFNRLSAATMQQLEDTISPWLDQVCRATGVSRFTDTEAVCEKIVGSYLKPLRGTTTTWEV